MEPAPGGFGARFLCFSFFKARDSKAELSFSLESSPDGKSSRTGLLLSSHVMCRVGSCEHPIQIQHSCHCMQWMEIEKAQKLRNLAQSG